MTKTIKNKNLTVSLSPGRNCYDEAVTNVDVTVDGDLMLSGQVCPGSTNIRCHGEDAEDYIFSETMWSGGDPFGGRDLSKRGVRVLAAVEKILKAQAVAS